MAKDKKPKKRVSAGAQSVAAILPIVGRQIHLDKKVQEWSVLSLWPQVVDAAFQQNTRAVKIVMTQGRRQLVVFAKNAAVASELTFYLEQYQEALNQFAPQTGVTLDRIECRVGS